MNWLQKIANLDGEWWIIDGYSQYADGDIGDAGHDVIVYQNILSSIEYVEISEELQDKIDQGLIVSEYDKDNIDEEYPGLFYSYGGNYESYSSEEAKWDRVISNSFHAEEKVAIEESYPGYIEYRGMPKDYAVEHMGWIRVIGSNFELQKVDNNKLSEIVRHIYDESLTDEDVEICINERSTGGYVCMQYGELAERVNAGSAEGYFRMKQRRERAGWY